MRIIVLLILSIGEAIGIWAEMMGARAYAQSGSTFTGSLLPTVLPILASAAMLITAYTLGLKAFNNIWAVSAISIGSILVVEPLFNLFYIGEMPTLGSGLGFAFGVAGILSSFLL